jgi:aldehyde dehydrogenase (NAD+)
MNAVMKEASPIRALFEGLAANAPAVADSTVEQRVAKLQKLLKATLDARPAILEAGRKELGLVDTDIDAQLLMIKTEVEFAAKHLKEWVGRHKVQGSLMTLGKKSYVQYEPKGVVLAMGAWNAAIAISLVPAIGAIAAGNTVMIKPSELAPHSARVIADIVRQAFPANEVTVVEGGPEVAQEVLQMPFNHIFFIGGHAVGRLVMRAAAEHFASVTLEMGGKNPVIVGRSADLEEAGRKLSWGRLANAGQVCVAPDYALVHESIERPFIESLKKWMKSMYDSQGKGFDQSPEMPRIINARHTQRIKELIDDAVAKGARVEFGGRAVVEDRFVEPTILSNVNDSMRVMQEEVFGPVIAVLPFKTREQAVAEIRKRPKPLSLYVFSKDREEIDWLLNHTTSGNGVVNHNLIQSGTNPWLPFGGCNASGIGRLGGRYTFLECSNARSIVEEGPAVGDPNMMFPPYSDKYKKMVAQLLSKPLNVPDAVVNLINGVIKLKSAFSKG